MITALLQLDNGRDRACSGWSCLPGSVLNQVVVTASRGSAQAASDALSLYHHLASDLARHHAPGVPTPCRGSFDPGVMGCWASSHSGPVRRTLVWVADGTGSPPVVGLAPPASPPWTAVLPLLPSGTPATLLPNAASAFVARWYDPGAIGMAVPDVLVAAGLGLDQFRIFVSYRWDDCRNFAEQLFDTLSHERFDVYLDRFRTNPGTNFAERIRMELADKTCLVLLDSKDVRLSPWVGGEYAFARLYKLGLMAIDLPGGRRSFSRIGTRHDMRKAWRGSTFSHTTALPQSDIDNAVAFVRAKYLMEVSRRFRHQRQLVASAARMRGVPTRARPDGLVEASARTRTYLFAASARPPGIEPFRFSCEAAASHSSGSAKGVVVAPLAAQTHQSRQDVKWLAGKAGGAVVDERRLFRAMGRAAAGAL